MSDSANELGCAPVGRLLFKLAVPTIAAQIVNMLYNIVDRIYIGHIPDVGSQALTGVGVTFPIILLISAFSALIGMGGAPLCSIERGKGNEKEAEAIMGNSFTLLVLCGLLLTAFGLIFKRQLLYLFGASDIT